MTPEQPEFGPPDRRGPNYAQRYSRWAMWGCGVLVLMGILFFAGIMLVMVRNPGLWRASEQLARCEQNLTEVSGAIDRYRTDRGRLPDSLDDLYPTYLAKREALYCPADARHGAHTSYRLRPGVEWGKGEGIVVYCPLHPIRIRFRSRAPESATNVVPVIRQDGSTDRVPMTDEELSALGGR